MNPSADRFWLPDCMFDIADLDSNFVDTINIKYLQLILLSQINVTVGGQA